MKRHLGEKYSIHVVSFDDEYPLHIDSTFSLIGPGLVIVNPTRLCHQLSMFQKAGWKVILIASVIIGYICRPRQLCCADGRSSWAGDAWYTANVDEFQVALNERPHAGSKEGSGFIHRDPHSEDVWETRNQVHQGLCNHFKCTFS